jgi:hypothetical protein
MCSMTAMFSATDSSPAGGSAACHPARKTLAGSACRRITPRLRRRASPPASAASVAPASEYLRAAADRRYACPGNHFCVAVGGSGHNDGVLADIAVLSAFFLRYACGRLPWREPGLSCFAPSQLSCLCPAPSGQRVSIPLSRGQHHACGIRERMRRSHQPGGHAAGPLQGNAVSRPRVPSLRRAPAHFLLVISPL